MTASKSPHTVTRTLAAPLLGVVFALMLLGGCYAPPLIEGDPAISRATDWEEILGSTVFWERHDVPRLRQGNFTRVVISEFSVEFVETRVIDSFPEAGTLAWNPQPSLLGFGRHRAEFDARTYNELPTQLHADFVQYIELSGLEVVHPDTVRNTKAYGRYVTADETASSFGQHFNPSGTDLGRIRKTRTVSLAALPVVTDAEGGDFEDVDGMLLAELDADLVIRVRFRVGVHDGRASMEAGSRISVTGRNILGTLRSDRSLLSQQTVVKDKSFVVFSGTKHTVHDGRYKLAMQSVFNNYVTLLTRSKAAE